jgi:hypothetical protein
MRISQGAICGFLKIAAIHVGYSEEEIPVLVDEINSAWSKAPSEGSSPN